MKTIYRFFLLLIFFSSAVFAQESTFYDAPFGGGGGYVGGWIIPKVDGINTQLKNFSELHLSTGGFYTSGGAGFIYLGIVPGIRIGGMGFGGSRSSSSSTLISNGSNSYHINNEAIYRISGGALTIEYTLPFIKNFGVSAGISIGRGSLELDLYSNTGGAEWSNLWSQSSGQSVSLINSYWLLSPIINIDIPAYRLLDFRVGIGYQLTFGSHWTYDNNKDIYNAPSDINGNSFFIQAGIFVGLFSF